MNDKSEWLYIGDDENYRFALGKPRKNNLVIIGLNPSTATPDRPDPTIRRIEKIAGMLSYDGWIVINLCAVRTPKPDELPMKLDGEISEKNIKTIAKLQKEYYFGAVYAAWGSGIEKRFYLLDECQKIADVIKTECWYTRGMTQYGHPKHPLYVPYTQGVEPFAVQDYIWSFE